MIGLFAISMLRMMLCGSIEVRVIIIGSGSGESPRLDGCSVVVQPNHCVLGTHYILLLLMLMIPSK